MYFFFNYIRAWLSNILYSSLEGAYSLSKQVRAIQRDYIFYKQVEIYPHSWNNVSLYMNFILNKLLIKIHWNLLQYRFFQIMETKIDQLILQKDNKNDVLTNVNYLEHKLERMKDTRYVKPAFKDNILESNFFLNKHELIDDKQNINRKILWIEATLIDLQILKRQFSELDHIVSKQMEKSEYLFPLLSQDSRSQKVSYESVGLVPRSITRTFSRFKMELTGRSSSLILPEFRLAKYQAVASLQYVTCLVLIPWILSTSVKALLLEPLVTNWWNTSKSQIFINVSQEQTALKKLQDMEELLWLDITISGTSHEYSQNLTTKIHQKTIELVDVYNTQSIETIIHLFVDILSVTTIGLILTWGKKRLAILNSWIQELFYSLSDTMKAFLILLFTDLCIGFHSPHGWEILIDLLLEHLGFSHNKHVISCFVSTFPVILDTVLKYWIFRHLNSISPSIVVTYHTMNE